MTSNPKQDALIHIMNRAYGDISMVEEPHGLVVSDSDLRPRIEYFHDAVRVLTQHPEAAYLPNGRLAVERLAWDLRALRTLQEKPLLRLDGTPYRRTRSDERKIMQRDVSLPAPQTPEMNNALRGELAGYYKTYNVMFAALFAESANRNFKTRQENHDNTVEELAEVEQMIRLMEQGRVTVAQVEDAIDNVQSPDLRHQLMAILHHKAMAKNQKNSAMLEYIKAQIKGLDGLTANMDKAHMSYLSGQMMLFQDAQSLIKKLAGQGMNLAGQFLANAVQQAGRGTGRGV